MNSSSQTSIVNPNIPHLCKRDRKRKRGRCNVRCIGVSVHSEFSKIRAGCRLWELMGRRRHSLLFRISLILTELALASTSATPVLFPLSLLPRLLVLTLFTASSGSSWWSRASCMYTQLVELRSGRNDRFLRLLEVVSQLILYFVALLCIIIITWIISVIR